MANKLPNSKLYRNKIDVIQRVARQIEKDLDLHSALTVSDNPEQAFYNLKIQVGALLKKRNAEHLIDLKQLLYRIDVSEQQIADSFTSLNDQDEFSVYAHAIVEREFQKVLTRIYFSQSLDQ